jgi:transposase
MTKRFRDSNLDQILLLPLSFHDWLPEDHLAPFLADVMKEMNTAALYAEYQGQDGRGQSAYDPLMMARVLLYGYCLGITSSRRIQRATYEDLGFRYLSANQHPDHSTIADFRTQQRQVLADLFLEALRLCQEAGMVKLGNVAIDGTKILANASTRRSLSYEKLQEQERYWEKIIADLLAAAEQSDAQEDLLFGKEQLGDTLPPKLANAKSRLETIREAKAELEREAQQHLEELERKAQAEKEQAEKERAEKEQAQKAQAEKQAASVAPDPPVTQDASAAPDASATPEGSATPDAFATPDAPAAQDAPVTPDTPAAQDAGAAPDAAGVPDASVGGKKRRNARAADQCRRRDKAKKQLKRARQNAQSPGRQYNFVDPESRVMPDSRHKMAFVQAYNAQAAADSYAQVIVAAEVTQQINDKQQLIPMTKAIRKTTGAVPATITADCGYWDSDSLHDEALKGIEVLVATDAKPPGETLPSSAPRSPEAQRMRETLATDAGQEKYRMRKAVIEPVFGQIKEVRGIRRFRLRGLDKVSCEWKLICATHNLLKLHLHRYPKPKPKPRTKRIKGGAQRKREVQTAFCLHGRSSRRYPSLPAYSSQPPNRRSRPPATNRFSISNKLSGCPHFDPLKTLRDE